MPRVDIKKKEYKLKDFKGWVRAQMHINHKTQKEVGEVLGLSQSKVSVMLKTPDTKKKEENVDLDPFSYGQLLVLFQLFDTPDEERLRLLKL